MLRYWHALLDLVYPDPCRACGTALLGNESIVCTRCRVNLPRTDSHLVAIDSLRLKFAGKVPVQNVYAFLKFERAGKVQRLLHQLKYNNQPEVGLMLGRMYGHELRQAGVGTGLDLIVPVPLHPRKLAQRGYNQSDSLAEGLSEGLGVAWSNEVLVRQKFTETQTGKSRFERSENVAGIFEVIKPASVENQHIVVVDDVMTTGATLESAIEALLQNKAASVTVVALAAAV
ncbi:MAG: ComF family protein [Runella slithyformis]|nr:MAG: ComF family protein [Runella slithyformis]